eukprot:1670091-Rhodomonas_salina.1
MVTLPRVVQDEVQGQWDARDPYFAGARLRNFLPASDYRTTTQILSGVSKASHSASLTPFPQLMGCVTST